MKDPTFVAILLLFIHFLTDWIFQPREMAIRKSTEWVVLLAHLGIILCGLCFFMGLTGRPPSYQNMIVVLGYTFVHGIQDRYLWRIYGKYYHDPAQPEKKGAAFYNFIALDQFLHLGLLMYLFL